MTTGWHVKANDIKQWTQRDKRRAEELLPLIVRRLINASSKPTSLHFPSGDSISTGGWDGILEVDGGNVFVPKGKSVWEFGTDQSINPKANNDYEKRTANPGIINPSENTFVFVTSRTWKDKVNWCSTKKQDGIWKEIRGLNADDIENWLHQCPGVHRWFASLIGKRVEGIWDIEQSWKSWAYSTSIPATYDLVLNGRTDKSKELLKLIRNTPNIVNIKASSGQEAYAFIIASLINDDLSSRVLVVKNQNQWDLLLDSQNMLILIPYDFTPSNIGYAKERGHSVILPKDFTTSQITSKVIEIKKMKRGEVIKALESMGISKDQAEGMYSDTRGYLGPIRRHEILNPVEDITPLWVNQFDANVLGTILFATEWDTRRDKDKDAVTQLAGMPYNQLEEKLSEISLMAEPPIRAVGTVWQVISKLDLWSLIAKKINKQMIERLEVVVFKVLSDTDPSYDLALEDRYLASIKGKIPEYSDHVKSGLSNTLVLLAVFGDNVCHNLGGINLKDRVAYWIRELLKNADSELMWYSLRNILICLAEASPDSFLDALEIAMEGENPAIKKLFEEGEGFFGECLHSHLLWALETISWNMEYLPRVTQALARLVEIDPGGRYSNRPFNSLLEIYLGWINNTRASHQERLQIIDANLIKFYPDIAWKLLNELLPRYSGRISSPIHEPCYRNWAVGVEEKVKDSDYLYYNNGIADRLIQIVDENPISRWPELIKNLTRLPSLEHFNKALNKLRSLSLNDYDNEVRHTMADKLRDTISSHRKFKDAGWAWPKKHIDKLEEVFHFIEPDDPVLKNRSVSEFMSQKLDIITLHGIEAEKG